MITLNIITDICQWWWLWWLLPFLLGLLLGWLIWGKYARQVRELEDELGKRNQQLNEMEAQLQECEKRKHHYKEALSISESRLKELSKKLENSPEDSDATTISGNVVLAEREPVEEEPEVSGVSIEAFAPAGSQDPAGFARLKEENLQIIEGIGPKMEEVLHENNINNWGVLAQKSVVEIQDILDRYGDKYKIIDPASWPDQARMANEGRWNDLIRLQKQDGSESKAEKVMIRLGILRNYTRDDLKAIEGIGPKIDSLLQQNGISTWQQLAHTSVDQLDKILSEAGAQYRLADASSWPRQAELADKGKWEELNRYQETLRGGNMG